MSSVAKLQDIIQQKYRRSGSELIEYFIMRESKILPNEIEYEIVCRIEGKEYGRGIGSNHSTAKEQAANNVLKNQEFIIKYLEQQ